MIADALSVVLDVILGLLDIFIGIFNGNWERAWNGVILLTSVVMEMRNLYIMYEATHKVYYLQQLNIKVASFATLSIAFKLLGKKINKLRDAVMDAINEAGLGGKCFVAGTLVSTPTGLVPIEDIKAGDAVLSFNEKTLEVSEQIVEETFVRQSKELVKITVGDEIITTTPEHPFYMPQKGFVKAVDLRAGDCLWTVNGECVIIEKTQHEIIESSVRVYNFRVARNHTYYVGTNEVGVHNADYTDPVDPETPENIIKDLRSKLPTSKNPETGDTIGNVGKVRGQLEINGQTTDFNENAYSQYGSAKHSPDGKLMLDADGNVRVNSSPDAKKWIQYPQKPSFNDFVSKVGKIWRYNDSECKLIEYVTERIGSDPNPRGEIEIITERTPCDSCKNVIKAFSEEYSGIKIKVSDGKGGSYMIQDGEIQ